jgi:tRNA modification GTPase
MKITYYDTIAAISTPMGEGGIGIVRISGPEAVSVAGKVFSTAAGPVDALSSHTIHYGVIIDFDTGEHVDEGLLSVMRSPRTYTREDVVEINCHGGVLTLKKTLDICLRSGARLAEPGEFTKRAFLNGRIDLSQAEAVIDIIRAKTEAALKVSLKQLEGGLSGKVRRLRDDLVDILAGIEAAIDFPEDDVEIVDPSSITLKIKKISREIKEMIESCGEGRLLREGIVIVLAGKPNVGKSSLLNTLLEEERAIVTPVPGTTRDPIEEYLNIGGFPVRLIDTAGLADSECMVEKEGVKRSGVKIGEAGLVLAVFDGGASPAPEDEDVIRRLDGKKVVAIVNKSDLPQKFPIEFLKRNWPDKPVVCLSAIKSEGIDKLKAAIVAQFTQADTSPTPLAERLVVSDVRHCNALVRAGESLKRLLRSLEAGYSAEFPAVDLKESLDHLGDILGETTTEDILDRIFSRFCIGK